MSKLRELWHKSPALVIGIVGAAILAALQQLAGEGVIGADIVTTASNLVGTAEAPGPLVLILAALVTRLAVYSPNTVERIAAQAAATGSPTVTEAPP